MSHRNIAYKEGRNNFLAGESGPNLYPEETQEWDDYELGWSWAKSEQEAILNDKQN